METLFLHETLRLLAEPWVLMILVASVMFAAGNYVDELLLHKYEQPIGVLIMVSGLFGLILMIFFALMSYATDTSLQLPEPIKYQAIGVGILEMLWVIPYLYAVRRRGAIVAGPLFQAVPVIALGFEAMYGIIPPFIQVMGALFIILGGITLSIEKDEDEAGEENHRIDWVTIGLMLVSVTLVALIYVLFKDASVATSYIAVGFWSGLGMLVGAALVSLVYPPYRREFNHFCRHANGKAVAVQLGNEVLDAGGAYLTHLANTIGPSVMLVTAFNATQPIAIGIVGALLAWAGFRVSQTGGNSWMQHALMAMAIIWIAIGTVLMALGITE